MFISNSGTRGYTIANSLRLRSSASAYLSRTFGTPTDNNVWTYSGWFKRGQLGVAQTLLGVYIDASNLSFIGIRSDEKLEFIHVNGGVTYAQAVTAAVYRDPSAHMHIVVVGNRAEGTDSNRIKMYVNGVQITAWTTTPTWNAAQNVYLNQNRVHSIGRQNTIYADGYLSDIYFIDGQALTPSSFGQTDTNGVWVPKAYSGTFGTNGFFLRFNDGSNTTNLCLDRSGNGNNWTPTNVSLTAGVTYDWMVDTPTNNYPVLNPLTQRWSQPNAAYGDGNLKVTTSSANSAYSLGTIAQSSGKWYWEATVVAAGTTAYGIGVGDSNVLNNTLTNGVLYQSNGNKSVGGSATAYGSTFTTNDVIGVALDLGGGTVTFYKNNTSQGAITLPSSTDIASWTDINTPANLALNFGQRPFSYTPPTGFKALCSQNLPAVTIANPKRHFDVVTYTGNGATQSITGLQFQPDLGWIKCRSFAHNHLLFDAVRGKTASNYNVIFSNLTNAETNYPITSLDSGGFTVTNSAGSANAANESGLTFASWLWKANGSGVTNTAGSITSTVSANTTAGFSIVTYTGTNTSGQSVGHGLGVVPAMVITKRRGSTGEWMVKHKSLGSNLNLILNQTSATYNTTSGSGGGIADLSSSSVFSFVTGSVDTSNSNPAGTMVAYCFAEVPGFSRFGSYTGNGSADGPFVFCGFRPRYVMVKRSDSTGNWVVFDAARDDSNVVDLALYTNLSSVEGSGTRFIDFTSNGFKNRGTDSDHNANTGTYIFMAFAESPFGASNIAPSTAR